MIARRPPDIAALLAVLADQGVKFVITGGIWRPDDVDQRLSHPSILQRLDPEPS